MLLRTLLLLLAPLLGALLLVLATLLGALLVVFATLLGALLVVLATLLGALLVVLAPLLLPLRELGRWRRRTIGPRGGCQGDELHWCYRITFGGAMLLRTLLLVLAPLLGALLLVLAPSLATRLVVLATLLGALLVVFATLLGALLVVLATLLGALLVVLAPLLLPLRELGRWRRCTIGPSGGCQCDELHWCYRITFGGVMLLRTLLLLLTPLLGALLL